MSGVNSDQLHRSTLSVYTNLMEQFNPGLQALVTLGNSYATAFQALAVTSEAYFSAVAKMGEQALHTLSSRSLGDVLVQISETQRRLTAEMEGVFRWFQVEVLQSMEKNIKLDEEYIDGSRRVYELEVRNQAEALERQLRRGAFRDSLEHSEYMQYLRQSQQDIMKEEERRYRFLAEKHCGLTQSLLFLINKMGASLQQKADGWKEKVNETRGSRPRTPTHPDQEAQLHGSVSSLLQTLDEDTDMSWARREQQALGRVPSRAPSPLPSRSRSSSVGESLGLGGGRTMRALLPHPPSSNPKLLPFARGETVTVLVQEPRNGWLYGRNDGSLRWVEAELGWGQGFSDWVDGCVETDRAGSRQLTLVPWKSSPALRGPGTPCLRKSVKLSINSSVSQSQLTFNLSSSSSVRRHSMNNLLDPSDAPGNQLEKAHSDTPTSVRPSRRASVDFQPISPLPERRAEPEIGMRPNLAKSYNELPPPTPPPLPPPRPIAMGSSAEFQPIQSPLPGRKAESLSPRGASGENPLFPRGSNPFATVKLRPTTTNDRSAPRIH
ncbi:hypothetical protein DPEC_G00171850 [Dallia pectoralis]|uniref:Uncharacterized protein n=1 Tax=Dallia pectoralis TaxID=75939 RepID=A0ACC2GDJ4_DALPE|nr:hypothetical protein DPEC_G00171850 [Dallia pectoralis]